MIIKPKNYFNNKLKWNKTYKINVVKNKNDLNKMISFLKDFIRIDSKNKFVGLDFEFNSSPEGKKIALFQINLESDSNNGVIYLFYPPDLDKNQLNILIELLTVKDIKKVLHGAESLDIPYLFKNIFVDDKLRKLFCNNLFDTRYLCEYYHLENKINDKCKIYHILKQMKVIDEKIMNMLLENEEKMGPIYLIDIDVRKLDNFTMLYSAFDVLYLPALLQQFPKNDIYLKLLPEITCFNYIDRYEDIFTKPFSELVGKVNNYYLKLENGNVKLIDIFQMYYYWVDDRDNILTKLMEINYFKKFIEIFIKFVVYKNILKIYDVWENNETITNILNDFEKEDKRFSKIKLPNNFEKFFNEITRIIKKDIV